MICIREAVNVDKCGDAYNRLDCMIYLSHSRARSRYDLGFPAILDQIEAYVS